jgi:sarcosine oxidase subunit alpha
MTVWRTHEIKDPVHLTVDGAPVVAERGEPVAMAIAASGREVFGRSVKYHRPRGPACYASRCDGCLMRVDGVPNVMTCHVGAEDGLKAETQNVWGSAELDVLSVTDWFFPKGLDHHHLVTRPATLNRAMQAVARRIAGIGKLPSEVAQPRNAVREATDVLIVGAGPAGLALAKRLHAGGVRPMVVDEHDGAASDAGAVDSGAEGAVAVERETVAFGVYDGEVALLGPSGIRVVRPRHLVFATGTHEQSVPVAGGDLPGVIGVAAALRLLAAGFAPGRRVVVVGASRAAEDFARDAAARGVTVLTPADNESLTALEGGLAVERAKLVNAAGDVRFEDVDAAVLEGALTGAVELATQAGASVAWRGEGFFTEVNARGETARAGVYAIGSCTGEVDGARVDAQVAAAAAQILGGAP